jgi:hypothetical protein
LAQRPTGDLDTALPDARLNHHHRLLIRVVGDITSLIKRSVVAVVVVVEPSTMHRRVSFLHFLVESSVHRTTKTAWQLFCLNNNDRQTSLFLLTGSIQTTRATSTMTTTATAAATADNWNKWDKQWNAMFEKLKAYKKAHGTCTVPTRYVCDDGTKLGQWVKNQRNTDLQTRDAALRAQRRRELDAIGFVWVVKERSRQLTPAAGVHASTKDRFNARWNVMFDKLKEYKAEHGNCLVPYRYNCTDGALLGHWVRDQRTLATTDSAMNPLRRRALDSIGFVWQVREQGHNQKWEEQWNEKFRLLQEYHAEHGDCFVPYNFITANSRIKLGSWVSHQRATHAAGKLHEDRLIRLESLGFSFRALPYDSTIAQWNRMFERLVEYRQRHGDCLVPKDDPKLGTWVQHLRGYRNTLSQDQRAQLDSIGFIWDAQDTQWQSQFEALERFQKEYGHCLVTKQHEAEYPRLQLWVKTQRERRGRGQMDGGRIQQLDGIGFVWVPQRRRQGSQ